MFSIQGQTHLLLHKNYLCMFVKFFYILLYTEKMNVYQFLRLMGYLFFEMVPINYRPVLMNGFLEASYPSSTVLLVLSVMPTLVFQTDRRCGSTVLKKAVRVAVILFSLFMVIGRLISGVHWVTDIAGSVLLSMGLYMIYRFMVLKTDRTYKKPERS